MSKYRFSNALGYTQVQLAEMHTASFSGYFFPHVLTPEASADFWRVHQIDANLSVVMHDQDGAFVGMARMGRRGQRGWCGGFGIAPEFRGSGASKLLAAQMVQAGRDAGLATLQLEVLTQNIRAIKLYEWAGFVSQRRLIGIELATDALPAGADIQTETAATEALLPWLAGAERPCWDRELATLLTMRVEALLAPGAAGRMNGVIVRRTGERAQVQTVVLQSDLTDAELAALLRRAAGNAAKIQVSNEPEASPFLTCCRRLDFAEFFSQYEMLLTL